MKKINKLIHLALLTVLFLTFNIRQVDAEDNLVVSVNAVLPENQHNKDNTYYDLRMKPGQEQELDLELINPTDKAQKVKIELNDATTNDTGTIDYSDRGEKFKRDGSLKLSVTDVAKIPKEATVKANSKEIVKIKLKMPDKEFKGIILGGVQVTEAEEKEDKNQKKESGGMQIKNKIAYTIGIKLSQTDDEVKPELDLKRAFADQTGGRNVVKANIQNSEPQKLDDIMYKAEVSEKGKKEILHQGSAQNYRFAPNSNFNFDVSWESQPFKAGDYNIHMTAESKKTGQKWEWNKEFEITETDAKELNDKAIDLDKDNKWLYIIIGMIILILLIVLVVMYKLIQKKKKEKRIKELKKKKKNSKRKVNKKKK